MAEEQYIVEQIDFGANDDVGQFYQALIIREGRITHFILHRCGIDYQDTKRPKSIYQMVEFFTEEQLLSAGSGYGIRDSRWKNTDETCGFDISIEEFLAANKRRRDADKTELTDRV